MRARPRTSTTNEETTIYRVTLTPARLLHLLGGGIMGDMGEPLPASRLAVLPATSHNAVITQPALLHGFIELFLKGETPKGCFQ